MRSGHLIQQLGRQVCEQLGDFLGIKVGTGLGSEYSPILSSEVAEALVSGPNANRSSL